MAETSRIAGAQTSSARLVVFVGGFDPRGARHYHQLLQHEAEKQSGVSGQAYAVGARQRWEPGLASGLRHSAWSVTGEEGLRSEYLFMDWSDEVRAHWPKRMGRVLWQGLQTYAVVLRHRSRLGPLHQETPYTLWTLAYPLVYMLLCVALAWLAMWGGGQALAGAWGVCLGLVAAAVVLWGGYRLDRVLHVSWLLRILNFARASSEAPAPVLHARLEQTAQAIAAQLQAQAYRDVVVVGFSVGSAIAVSLVRALSQRMALQAAAPGRLCFLTLGNCIPLFSLMPQAQRLREDLQSIARDDNVYWADISSPGDSVSFGMCNLLRLCLPGSTEESLAQALNPRHMCTPRFHKLFHAHTYRWLRRNKMRMHFQYLMASELPGTYNYFELLTCKGSLADFIAKRLVR